MVTLKPSLSRALTWIACGSFFPLAQANEEVFISKNLVHQHHLHRYGAPHPTVPASQQQDRFSSSRVDARELQLPTKDAASRDEEFSFVIFGDRTGGLASGVNVLANAVRDANLLDPDLVMTVGDLVQGYNQAEPWLEEMKEYRAIMNQLRSPWFPTAGNHDVYYRGPKDQKAPKGGHADLYEKHFAPLWYAFEHKNSWFVVLYGDEGNPKTGEQTFSDPEAQQMSEAQFQWLDQTLKKAAGGNHVFLFIHHPRWTEGGYGKHWERVHQRLVEAKNVSAVFAGHIHHMQYQQKRDGIEYLTLATTGGVLPADSPLITRQHHLDLVRVRKDEISLAALPISATIDVREITKDLALKLQSLNQLRVSYLNDVTLPAQPVGKPISNSLKIEIHNPTAEPMTFQARPVSKDRRWSFDLSEFEKPLTLASQERKVLTLPLTYDAAANTSYDSQLQLPSLELHGSLQEKGAKYEMEPSVRAIPVTFATTVMAPNQALLLDGKTQWISIPSSQIDFPKTLTVEAKFRPDRLKGRQGLVAKTQSSDYGLHVQGDTLVFLIHLGDRYVRVASQAGALQVGKWHHAAGVYDGKEVRLYLDGKLVDTARSEGKRKKNTLPLIIGADVDGATTAVDPFQGAIDEVRLSKSVLYQGQTLAEFPSPKATSKDLIWYKFDQQSGPYHLDLSGRRVHRIASGQPELISVP